jgi:hypothetical protein
MFVEVSVPNGDDGVTLKGFDDAALRFYNSGSGREKGV